VATASGYLADRKGFVEILDARTGAPTGPSLTLGNDVHAVAFDAAGERLLVASDESALLYEVASRRRLAEPLRHSAGVEDVAFSRNGLRIVTRTENDGCFLWENPLPRPLARPHSRPSPDPTQALQRVASDAARACRDATVTCREYSPDGCLLAAGLDNGSVWLIPADGASAPRGPLEQSGEVIGLRFSADGTRLAVRSGDKYGQGADVAVTVWDCTARRKVFGPYRDPEGISSACPSPDGSRILLGLRDGRARLCTLNNGQSIVSPRLLTGRIVATAFDPRGRIAAVADENRVRFCDARTGAPSAASLWHPDRIYCLEFSPNGRFLATGSADNAARVWDTRTGSLRAGPLPHAVAVFSVAFSRDGRWLLTAAAAALRVWSVDAGLPLTDPIEAAADAGGTPAAAPEVISRARFQSDNLRLAASSRQRLWTGEAISPADRLADAEHLRRVCECLSGIVMDAASGRPARLGERERLRLRQVSATSPPAAGPFDDLLYWASGVGEAPDGATTNGPFVVCP
jgi:WD40 repeat protein